jgi:hypothetical protein
MNWSQSTLFKMIVALASMSIAQTLFADRAGTVVGSTATGAAIGGLAGGGRGAGIGAAAGLGFGLLATSGRDDGNSYEKHQDRKRREREAAEDRAYDQGVKDGRHDRYNPKRYRTIEEEEAYEDGFDKGQEHVRRQEERKEKRRQEQEAAKAKKAKKEEKPKAEKPKKETKKVKESTPKNKHNKPSGVRQKPYYPMYERE